MPHCWISHFAAHVIVTHICTHVRGLFHKGLDYHGIIILYMYHLHVHYEILCAKVGEGIQSNEGVCHGSILFVQQTNKTLNYRMYSIE